MESRMKAALRSKVDRFRKHHEDSVLTTVAGTPAIIFGFYFFTGSGLTTSVVISLLDGPVSYAAFDPDLPLLSSALDNTGVSNIYEISIDGGLGISLASLSVLKVATFNITGTQTPNSVQVITGLLVY